MKSKLLISPTRSPPTRSKQEDRQPKVIVSISGGTGRTADQVLHAALAQFENPQICIVQKSNVRSPRVARSIVASASRSNAIIVHTLVAPRVRDALVQEAERRMIPSVDLLGPVINLLADHLHACPRNQPGLSYELRKEQFDRIDSVDFTLAHDDGARLRTLANAEVVLVGISRVAKSVTCFYLAYRGIRAANVPIVLNEPVPKELLELDPQRVIGLTMNVERLKAIRSARMGNMGYGRIVEYVDRKHIFDELKHGFELMRKHKWRMLDVSYLSVEEIATEIISLMEK